MNLLIANDQDVERWLTSFKGMAIPRKLGLSLSSAIRASGPCIDIKGPLPKHLEVG
jgi:hypothetical protein